MRHSTAKNRPDRESADSPSRLDRCLKVSVIATVIGAVASLIAVFGYAAVVKTAQPPMFCKVLIWTAVAFLGLTFVLAGPINRNGAIYSGLARRRVTRQSNPVHFWIAIAAFESIGAFLVTWGSWNIVKLL